MNRALRRRVRDPRTFHRWSVALTWRDDRGRWKHIEVCDRCGEMIESAARAGRMPPCHGAIAPRWADATPERRSYVSALLARCREHATLPPEPTNLWKREGALPPRLRRSPG